MDDVIMVDSCVLIEYFRSKNKQASFLESLSKRYRKICISTVAKYEVLCGARENDSEFWRMVFEQIEAFPFDESAISTATSIFRQLKRESRQLNLGDILIAATAIANDLPLATPNRKHFERIVGLRLVE